MIFKHIAVTLALGLVASIAKADVEFPSASPSSTVKQKVGLTDVEVVYSRPSLRGRKIFGSMIPYGEVWRTGANSATRVTFSTDVTLGDAKLASGSYELFTIPGESEWTVIVQKLPEKASWGAYSYKPENDTARFKAKPETLPTPVESFTIGFADVTDAGSNLVLEWDRTRVPVKLSVDTVGILTPKIHEAIASGQGLTWSFYYGAASLLYNNGGDSEQALKWVDESIKLRAGFPGNLLLKTRLLVKLGRNDEAKAAAADAVESGIKLEGPDSVMARQAKDLIDQIK